MKVYFFPGLGADESLARFHHLPGHDVEWVRWPRRIADTWDGFVHDLLEENPIEEGAAFIGISFGGMAALQLARKRPRGVILLGSCRSSRAITPSLRLFKPLVPCLPGFLFNVDLLHRPLAAIYFGIRSREHLDLLFAMGRKLSPGQFRALNSLALRFDAGDLPGLPIYSLHGSEDRMILAQREKRDAIVAGAGHLVSMTHPDIVNQQLLEWLRELEAGPVRP
jgi:pimeloyl-ACP methyl ester carboxylesterase